MGGEKDGAIEWMRRPDEMMRWGGQRMDYPRAVLISSNARMAGSEHTRADGNARDETGTNTRASNRERTEIALQDIENCPQKLIQWKG